MSWWVWLVVGAVVVVAVLVVGIVYRGKAARVQAVQDARRAEALLAREQEDARARRIAAEHADHVAWAERTRGSRSATDQAFRRTGSGPYAGRSGVRNAFSTGPQRRVGREEMESPTAGLAAVVAGQDVEGPRGRHELRDEWPYRSDDGPVSDAGSVGPGHHSGGSSGHSSSHDGGGSSSSSSDSGGGGGGGE